MYLPMRMQLDRRKYNYTKNQIKSANPWKNKNYKMVANAFVQKLKNVLESYNYDNFILTKYTSPHNCNNYLFKTMQETKVEDTSKNQDRIQGRKWVGTFLQSYVFQEGCQNVLMNIKNKM